MNSYNISVYNIIMYVHSVSMKGKRPQNEDNHTVILNLNNNNECYNKLNFFGVFDGHGGKHVSDFLNKNLPKYYVNKSDYTINKKFINGVHNYINNHMNKLYKKESKHCGSTCLYVIQQIINNINTLHVVNLGDSRCVLCRDNIAIPLTKDHKPNWPEEKLRIETLGGYIYPDGEDWRVGDLSVSRAFGDFNATPYITHVPEIFKYKLISRDKFIVLACDGLWDVLENQEVINFILENAYDIKTNKKLNNTTNIAKKLAEYAINMGSTDNITVIIIFL